MNQDELKARTKEFTLRILNLVDALPRSIKGRAIAAQIVRSGTSVGSNYRAACRARSKLEFIAKIGIVVEEADETAFWLEIIIEGKILKEALVGPLLNETNEILAIMTQSRKTAQSSLNGSQKSAQNRQSAIGNRQ